MSITAYAAAWFLPFVVPVCLWVMYTDVSRMKITNTTNMVLLGIFMVIGLIVLPFTEYLWHLVAMVVVLVVAALLNALGAMGGGDSKFIAAAAPFIAFGDVVLLMWIFAISLVAALVTHRIVKHSPLRTLAPDWASWDQGKKFPMGLALGPALIIYLGLGALNGA
jgi:prepilin peptidase CpaA